MDMTETEKDIEKEKGQKEIKNRHYAVNKPLKIITQSRPVTEEECDKQLERQRMRKVRKSGKMVLYYKIN